MSALRIKILLCLAVIVPLGFGFKYYSGPGAFWFNAYGAAVFYEIFWCLCAFFFFTKRRDIPIIAVTVFIITCVLETMQLWHPPLLEAVRGTHFGAWIIGTTFDWLDFPHYIIGSGFGWASMRFLDRK
jgi:hypothetical protein